jgi:hypothetical protein
MKVVAKLQAITVAILVTVLLGLGTDRAVAASSAGCDGGGFTVLGLSGSRKAIVPAKRVGSIFLVKGKYVEFSVDSSRSESGTGR